MKEHAGSGVDTSSVPEDVLTELSELGMDTMAILKAILGEFGHLLSGRR